MLVYYIHVTYTQLYAFSIMASSERKKEGADNENKGRNGKGKKKRERDRYRISGRMVIVP